MMEASNETGLPTAFGDFRMRAFRDERAGEHLAIYKDLSGDEPLPVRIHSECLTGDTLRSLKCDCGEQLVKSLIYIEERGRGAVIYLRQEGRGIGLFNKINAYALQEDGMDTVEANNELGFPTDLREYEVAANILIYLGIRSVSLLTNNKEKIKGLSESGIDVVERIPLTSEPNEHNQCYLATKRSKMDHML